MSTKLRIILRVFFATSCAGLLFNVPVHAAEEPQAAVNVTLQKKEDRAAVKVEGEAVVVTITSPSGIGRAEIAPTKEWPKTIELRLALKGLEGFQVRAGETVGASRLGGKDIELTKRNAEGRAETLPNNDGRWQLDISQEKDAIRVRLPTEPFRGEKSIHVQWVDFYR